MPTRNINLTEHFDRFVDSQVGSGRYSNASEVLRAGLRLLELQEKTENQKLKLLRKLATEGFQALDQGEGITAEDENMLRTTITQIGRKTAISRENPQAH